MGDRLAVWRFYLGLYRGLGWPLAAAIAGAVAQPLLLLPIAPLVKYVLEQVVPTHAVGTLVAIGALILVLYALHGLAALGVRHLTLVVTKQAVERLRNELLARLYAAPQGWYRARAQGALLNVLTTDCERVDQFSSALVSRALPAALTAGVLLMVLLALNWTLCLVLGVLAPLYFFTGRPLARALRGHTRRHQEALRALGASLHDALSQRDLAIVHGQEARALQRQAANVHALRRTSHAMLWWALAYEQVQGIHVTAAGVIVLTLGGVAVASGQLSVGGLLAYYVALALLAAMLQQLGLAIPPLLAGQAALAEVWDCWRALPPPARGGSARITLRGAVRFERVGFGYGDAPVLRDLSLDLAPGEQVAVVGPNGAGKSTLAALLLGIYQPTSGRVLLDGVSLDQLDLPACRRQIGVVPQVPLLFAGTIRENIAYAAPESTHAAVERAARLATAHDFIAALPAGYDTRLGDGGEGLSGGERQRLALARALVHQPRLLLLDEPTNHLDAASIRALLANLAALPEPPTILVISHDTAVVTSLPRVYRLVDGRLQPLAPAGIEALRA